MRNKLRKKVTLKTKIPPALSHGILLDQQKKKIDIERKMNCKRTKRENTKHRTTEMSKI